jgi:hypothetical protein
VADTFDGLYEDEGKGFRGWDKVREKSPMFPWGCSFNSDIFIPLTGASP